MEKVIKVKEWINENNPKNINEVMSKFRSDIESIIIASHFLDIDANDFIEDFSKRVLDQDELIGKIEEYIGDPKLFRKLIPRTVQTAITLFIDFDEVDLSKEVVLDNLNSPNYILSLSKNNLFDNSVVFFTTKIDIKGDDYLEEIENRIKSLNVIFMESSYKEIFNHFELLKFLKPDPFTKGQFIKLIDKYREDSFYPIMVTHYSKIINNDIFYYYDNQYIQESILGLNTGVDLDKFKENFIKEIKSEITDSLSEGLIQSIVASTVGLGLLDIGVKSVKVLFKSLTDAKKELSPAQVNQDYIEFTESGFSSVKEWFCFKTKNYLDKALKDCSIDQEIDSGIIELAFQNFFKRYYLMYSKTPFAGSIDHETQDAIFRGVYESVNKYSIQINTDSI